MAIESKIATGSGGEGGWSRGVQLRRFTKQVILGRWFMLFASSFIMLGSGITFLFNAYSKVIKYNLNYTQKQINTLNFFKELGVNFGIIAGLLNDVVPPWSFLLLSAAMNFGGYFMIYLAVAHLIPKPEEWQMWLYIWIGSNSQEFASTAALVASVKSFPERRGIVLGILKGYVGLSASVMKEFYYSIYNADIECLILLVSWLPSLISLVFLFSIRAVNKEPVGREDDTPVFYQFLYVSTSLALFLMFVKIVYRWHGEFKWQFHSSNVFFIVLFLLLPLVVVIREERLLWNVMKVQPDVHHQHSQKMENSEKLPEILPKEVSSTSFFLLDGEKREPNKASFLTRPPRGEDHTILQAICSMDMTIIFIAALCGIGSSVTAIENLDEIGESLGYALDDVKFIISLIGIWTYFGRIFSGFLSDALLLKYGVPRPLIMCIVLIFSCLGLLLVSFPSSASLYVASVILGFSFGAQIPLIYAMISEIFGLKNFATLLNYGHLACPFGSYILNVVVTGMLYTAEGKQQLARDGVDTTVVKEVTCIGPDCFSLAFLVLATVTFFGAVNLLILVMRTWDFYRTTLHNRLNKNIRQ